MSRQEAKLGLAGQNLAANRLRALGVLQVEPIGTPFTIVRTMKLRGQLWYSGFFGEKVSGDLHGHLPNGICILAEVKTIYDRNLRWSDLRPHQPERLDMHAENAISLLVWVHHTNVYVMNWFTLRATDTFGPGLGITPEQAQRLNIERL